MGQTTTVASYGSTLLVKFQYKLSSRIYRAG